MKKYILLSACLLTLFVTGTYAQQERMGRKTAEQRADLITKNLTEKLSLSESQFTEVREIVLKREKLRDAGKLAKDDRARIVADINKLLDQDQQKKWTKMRQDAKARQKQNKNRNAQQKSDDAGDEIY